MGKVTGEFNAFIADCEIVNADRINDSWYQVSADQVF